MLNKSSTHNQRTAFSSMTVWVKIRNTMTMYSHAESNSEQVTVSSLTEHSHAGKFCPQNLYWIKFSTGYGICFSTGYGISQKDAELVNYNNSDKSFISGLIVFIKSIFHSRFQFLRVFSHSIASPMSKICSKYTKSKHLYFVVKIEPFPLLCSFTLFAKLLVTPM